MNQPLSRVAVCHFGARLHYAVAVRLAEVGRLQCLFTDSYAGRGSALRAFFSVWPTRWMRGPLKRLSQRTADIPGDRVVAFNRLGFAYARALTRRPAPEVFLEFNHRLAARVIAHEQFSQADSVYGFCGASVLLFRAAKAAGKRCILEQMIAPVAEMAAQVRGQESCWPGWALSATDQWNEQVWTALEREEWALADLVLAPSH